MDKSTAKQATKSCTSNGALLTEAPLSEHGVCAMYGTESTKLSWDVESNVQSTTASFTDADAERVRENFHAAAVRASHMAPCIDMPASD